MAFTPAIEQYIEVKRQYADCILFFRIGDFYETFFEDAKTCSKVLDLILTSKNKNAEDPVPMAGIPFHSVDKYIPKLVAHGYKVAIAEQTSDPIPGKIVSREVTQIITPGTYVHEQKKTTNYMLSIHFKPYKDGQSYHIARGDFSLGEYRTRSFADIAEMQKFILTIKPSEIIFDIDFTDKELVKTPLQQYLKCLFSIYEVPFDAEHFLLTMTQVQSLASFGKALDEGRLGATTLLLNYIAHTQKMQLKNIAKISLHSQDHLVLLDDVTIKNLEIFTSSYENSEKYSLIGILDRTQTAGGSRLLRYLLMNPTNTLAELENRLKHISYYLAEDMICPQMTGLDTHRIHAILNNVSDIPKLMTMILYKKLTPSLFIKLRATLSIFFENSLLLKELIRLGLSEENKNDVLHVYNHLQQLLKNDEDYREDIDFIRDGYNEKIDELRKIAYHSDELLLQYQQELSQKSGVNNVKLKYVMNQGYFIEITNKDITQFEHALFDEAHGTNKDKFDVLRRNTLKGGQRYVSPYLDTIQSQVLSAKDDLVSREFLLLQDAKEKVSQISKSLTAFAEIIAWLDVYSAHALLAKEKNFNKPEFTNNVQLSIIDGRHPVIEEFLPRDLQFIPNDLKMMDDSTDDNDGFLHIVTGPNMGGKSTYLRQNALIVLMAHCGLFVPAKEVKLGLVDAIFARVGSGDVIAKNQSTFMTEMIEVANILHNATSKSFIIFDELGRGTSTYDGLALTKAILEYIATQVGAKTLIATHYHELIQLENSLAGVQNYSVSVYETDKDVIFMKKIIRGGADKSYGIDVAKLAGIPNVILERAKNNLKTLQNTNEKGGMKNEELPNSQPSTAEGFNFQLPASAGDPRFEKIKQFLQGFDLNTITPLQALQLLSKVKDEMNK
ncbi:MAG: DNA mismatch repair protein MutS [candidate division SR1 bacterium]|nr:DNA mismatch repair protein MutS [candidate division SR1 bacterium]